jgi:acyl-CoA thioesterase II
MGEFFDLRGTHNPHRWFLPVTEPICAGPPDNPFLFGGVGLAAAVKAMERTCGRPVVWATAQYLSFARPGSILDLDVWVPVAGRHTSQARVIGHVGDREIITVNAALGARPGDLSRHFLTPPPAPAPEDCRRAQHWRGPRKDVDGQFDFRIVSGRYPDDGPIDSPSPDGRLVLWVKPNGGLPIDSPMLAVIGDYVSDGISGALGARAGGNSLDNTIRFVANEPTEWVLCDIRIQAIGSGVVHGTMNIFSQSGLLMAIAAQSLILRIHTPLQPTE